MYSEAAVSLLCALTGENDELHIIDIKNQGTLDFMEDDDVIEISCNVSKRGCIPIPLFKEPSSHIKLLMRTIKLYEKHAVNAGMTGDQKEALSALLLHPLCQDHMNIKGALDEMLLANKDHLPQFFKEDN